MATSYDMAMSYDDAVAYVFGFTNYEFTPLAGAPAAALDLTRLRALLARLGDPQRIPQSVHITGSKGKGSTAAMIAVLLQQSGARVGLYTSPHLHTARERIAIDGEPISEAAFATLVSELRPQVEAENASSGDPLTTFELLTAMAFLCFRDRGCDWQVVEVGLGGRLDATNVLDTKALCVFTPISLEHTAILGPTTAAIASDKAGILRRGTRAVMAPQDAQAGAVIRRACADFDVPLASVEDECTWLATPQDLAAQSGTVQTPSAEYHFSLPLLGGHQIENAAVALRGIELLRDAGVRLAPEAAAAALAGVQWPGRLEVLAREPLVLVDGAHNGASALRLAESLPALLAGRRLTLVLGTLADKDLPGIVQALAPVASEVVAVAPDQPRARPAEEIAAAFAAAGVPSSTAPSVAAGIRSAIERATPAGAVCVAGSLYTVAEARAELLGLASR